MLKDKIKQSRILFTLFTTMALGILCMNKSMGNIPSVNATVIVLENKQEEAKAEEGNVSYVPNERPKNEVEENETIAVQAIVEEPAPEILGNIHIQASWLNVRETPNGEIIGKVTLGEQYEYYEEQNNWLKIKYKDSYGYIFGDYGNIYDVEGNLVAAANIPEPEQVVQEVTPEKPVQEQQQQVIAEPQPQKSPQEMSNQELYQWVLNQIITPDMDDFAKVRAVNQYLCNHMTYDLNYYTTRDAILLGRGRCQGYANTFKNLVNTLGIPTDYVRGYVGNDRSSTHAWNRVLIGGAYYCVDVTWNDSTGANSYLLINEAEYNRDKTIIEYNPNSE